MRPTSSIDKIHFYTDDHVMGMFFGPTERHIVEYMWQEYPRNITSGGILRYLKNIGMSSRLTTINSVLSNLASKGIVVSHLSLGRKYEGAKHSIVCSRDEFINHAILLIINSLDNEFPSHFRGVVDSYISKKETIDVRSNDSACAPAARGSD